MKTGTQIDAIGYAGLREKLFETARLFATPIDFEGLIKDGVIAAARGSWYEILKHEMIPEHAWQQVTELKSETRKGQERNFLKFSKKTAAAAKRYEKITGKPFKAA